MTAPYLLEKLRELGITVVPDGDNLRCTGKTSGLTPELVSEVRDLKPLLIRMLGSDPPMVCVMCGAEIEAGVKRGCGPFYRNGFLYHLATCLPPDTTYEPESGTVRVSGSNE